MGGVFLRLRCLGIWFMYVAGDSCRSSPILPADPVERAREKMRNAEEWRHLRWSMGALSSELRGASGNVMDASERYNQALLKRHRKELREATENFARAIWDHDGSPASEQRFDEAVKKLELLREASE